MDEDREAFVEACTLLRRGLHVRAAGQGGYTITQHDHERIMRARDGIWSDVGDDAPSDGDDWGLE